MKVEIFECIEIQGSEYFIFCTKEALTMLKETQCFKEIRQCVSIIKEAEHSGMRAFLEKPTYEVGAPTWRHSTIWYASTIVHDGYHSKLYHEAKIKNNGAEPDPDTWTGVKAEQECLEFQLQALQELKADNYLITYVENLIKNPTYQGNNKSWSFYVKRPW